MILLNSSSNIKKVVILSCAILITLQIFILIRNKSEDNYELNLAKLTISEKKVFFTESIIELGGKNAYNMVKAKNKGSSDRIGHTNMHIFGEVLYKTEGMSGIILCDSEFGFGCYHGFFLAAISENGTDSVEIADKECVKKFGILGLGCQHGIGHGLMEYYGKDNLEKALAACSKTSWKGRLLGCLDGVFMEYNLPTTITTNSSFVSNRKINKNNLDEPCPNINQNYQMSCYYSLADWLMHELDFKQIMTMCNQVSNDANKKACILGIGRAISWQTGYNKGMSIHLCALAENEEALCRAGLKWQFYVDSSVNDDHLDICEGLDESKKITCETNWNVVEIYN